MKIVLFVGAGLLSITAMAGLLGISSRLDKNSAYKLNASMQISEYISAAQDKSDPPLSVDLIETDRVLAAMVHPDRTSADVSDDGLRKVLDVLRFTGIGAGNTVLEMEAGSGYYTELLSFIVGKQGTVIMQNPPEFGDFVTPDVLAARLGEEGGRLSNVRVSTTSFDALDAPDASVDLVTWFLGPHELWMTNAAGEMTLGDPEKTYGEIFRVLKPGGRFVALDKSSPDYTFEHESSVSHKISPKHVIARAEAAGFTLTKTSDILSIKIDPDSQDSFGKKLGKKYDLNVVDPSKRVSTDRFLHMYTKPE